MDGSRFDELTRLLNRADGRRAVVGVLLALPVVAAVEAVARKRGRGKTDRRGNDRDDGADGEFPGGQQFQAEHRKRGKGKNKHKAKKKRGKVGNAGNQPPPPSTGSCCGTDQCPDPKAGTTRAGCDYSGRDFLGADLHGATLRGIDGRGTRFTAANLRGAVLADACLQAASFRRAKLAGVTWGGACLVDANFTDADLGEGTTLAGALLCGTILPDGSISNRDCARETACCTQQPPPQEEPGPECQPDGSACAQNGDCCGGNCFGRVCAAPPRFCGNETCSGSATGCCDVGGCCTGPANQCNPGGECCTPNCAGKACGADGCGNGGTCGSCPDNLTCDEQTGQCECTRQPVGGSCSTNGDCCSGNCCGGSCCDAGGSCCGGEACCPQPETKCCGFSCCFPTDTCCGGTDGFGICCPEPLGGFCTEGGQCATCFPLCQQGQRCGAAGQCICDTVSCPDGCCSAGPGNPGTCQPRSPGQPCPCTPQNCPTGCCDGTVCRTPPGDQFCGTNGAACVACGARQQCIDGRCCTRECATGQCGPIVDGCGGTIGCGGCGTGETPSCNDGVCASCPATCPDVRFCLNRVTGETTCCNTVGIDCSLGCSSDADCTDNPGTACVSSFTYGGTQSDPNRTFTFADSCGTPAICVPVQSC